MRIARITVVDGSFVDCSCPDEWTYQEMLRLRQRCWAGRAGVVAINAPNGSVVIPYIDIKSVDIREVA